jgi:hypothetical protein
MPLSRKNNQKVRLSIAIPELFEQGAHNCCWGIRRASNSPVVQNQEDDTITGNLGLGEFISRWNFGSEAVERIADSEAKGHFSVLVGANPAADMAGAQHIRMVEVHRAAGKAEVQCTVRTGEPEPPAFRTVEKRKVVAGKAGLGIAQLWVPNTVALVE